MKRIYVAGPYSHGDVALNIHRAVEAGDKLLRMGHAPFIPHLTGFWHMMFPQEYERWLEYDKAWLLVCDALYRLPGDSPGADREVLWAWGAGIRVFTEWHELEAWLRGQSDRG